MKTDTHTHTLGPWHVGAGNGEGSIFADNGRTRLEIGGTTLYSIAQITRGWDEAEDEANARLIASAPELLDACKAALAMFKKQFPLEHGNHELGATWGMLEGAIFKAEGRDS
jgi:hypothetical protein